MMATLFESFSTQSDNSELEYYPKSVGTIRSGLGFVFLLSVEKHARNTLKNTPFPTVPAIRTGQGLHANGIGPDPDGWESFLTE